MSSHYDFAPRFLDAYRTAEEAYRRSPATALSEITAQCGPWLTANGLSAQALYDYVDDEARYGEPGRARALTIESVRRDYFFNVQGGRPASTSIDPETLPPKDATVDGIAWLPRLAAKAYAKLRGELPSSLMYGCGGDRAFLESHDLDPAEFLTALWRCDGKPDAMAAWIRQRSNASRS